jgi:hypothetical protein
MRHRFAVLCVIAAGLFSGRQSATGATWNGYEEAEMVHIWAPGDTLTELLFSQGLGRAKGPLQLYGSHGWITRNTQRNKIESWSLVASGTKVVLVAPKFLLQPSATTKNLVLSGLPNSPALTSLAAAIDQEQQPSMSASDQTDHVLTEVGPEDNGFANQGEVQSDRVSPADAQAGLSIEDHRPRRSRPHRSVALPLGLCALVITAGAILLRWTERRARIQYKLRQEQAEEAAQLERAGTSRQMLIAAATVISPADGEQQTVQIAKIEELQLDDQPSQTMSKGLLKRMIRAWFGQSKAAPRRA